MVLKLDPDLPLLWRTPTSVQLGSPPVAVLDEVRAADELLLAALARGTARSGIEMYADSLGVPRARLRAMLERIGPALAVPRPRPRRIRVLGDAPLARALVATLGGATADDRPVLAVLVAEWVLAPEDHGRWLRRDVPHLPVVVSPRAVEVGPLVVSGDGPCLTCVHRHRSDRDPAWPAVESQLWRHGPVALDAVAQAEALALASRAVRRAAAGDLRPGESWILDTANGAVRSQQWRPHPDCLCRDAAAAPGGSGSEPGAGPGAPRAPTTARAAGAPG